MVQGSHSQKNVSLSTVSPSKQKQPPSPKETLAPSDLGPLDTLAPDASVYTPVFAPVSINKFLTELIKAYLEAQTPTSVQAEQQKQLLKG